DLHLESPVSELQLQQTGNREVVLNHQHPRIRHQAAALPSGCRSGIITGSGVCSVRAGALIRIATPSPTRATIAPTTPSSRKWFAVRTVATYIATGITIANTRQKL